MKVLIALTVWDIERYTLFVQSLLGMQCPCEKVILAGQNASPGRDRKAIYQYAQQTESTHILFLNNDHVFNPDTLQKLMDHDLDVVSAFYMKRGVPFEPMVFSGWDPNNKYSVLWKRLTINDHGLIKSAAVGAGFLLVKTSVYERIDMETEWNIHQTDDIFFSSLCRDANIPLYVDLDTSVGHITYCNIVPMYDKETGYKLGIQVSTLNLSVNVEIHDAPPKPLDLAMIGNE